MIVYNNASPATTRPQTIEKSQEQMTFPKIWSSYKPYSSLGSHVNYTIINANGILKSLQQARMLMLIRGASAQQISPKSSLTCCVPIQLVLILSFLWQATGALSAFVSQKSTIKTNPFSNNRAVQNAAVAPKR